MNIKGTTVKVNKSIKAFFIKAEDALEWAQSKYGDKDYVLDKNYCYFDKGEVGKKEEQQQQQRLKDVMKSYPGHKESYAMMYNRMIEKCKKFKLNFNIEVEKIPEAIRLYKLMVESNCKTGKYPQDYKNSSTWINNLCWQDDYRLPEDKALAQNLTKGDFKAHYRNQVQRFKDEIDTCKDKEKKLSLQYDMQKYISVGEYIIDNNFISLISMPEQLLKEDMDNFPDLCHLTKVHDTLIAMENHKPLRQKNKSMRLTLISWLKQR